MGGRMMNTEQVKAILAQNGIKLQSENRTGNDDGTKLQFDNGTIVNVFDSGKYSVQGKNTDSTKSLLSNVNLSSVPVNRKVFVVYGHDSDARTQLEAMLRRWDLEPLILDQLVTSGQTVIEKLEEYIGQADFGIVLATPDDIGYAKGKEAERKYRARQNVVLELGMLLSKIGRSKVAILLSQQEEMEKPSDIQGLIYIPFRENVEDAGKSLYKELSSQGYNIDPSKL